MEFCGGINLRNFIDKNMNNNALIDEDILKNIIKQICIGIKAISYFIYSYSFPKFEY